MAGAAPTPTKSSGGKKAVDATINLVPFIDLLSCCISFLLITAVWTQLARMDVTQKAQGPAGATPEDKPPEQQIQLTVFIDKDGYIFTTSRGESKQIPLKGTEYDYAELGRILAEVKKDVGPEKTDINVKSDDDIVYDKVIRTMDVAVTCGRASTPENRCFPDISLSDKGGG